MAFALSNLLFAFVARRTELVQRRSFERLVAAQLLLDSAVLGTLVAQTGGFASPFVALVCLPAFCAAVLLDSAMAYAVATVAALCPVLALTLVSSTADPRALLPVTRYDGAIFLALAIAGACSLGRRVVQRLREQESDLGLANSELERRLAELEDARVERDELVRRLDESSRRALLAELCTEIAHRIREPLGIARARSDKLRLEGPSADGPHDLALLHQALVSVQRGLRSILAFLPAGGVQEEFDVREVLTTAWDQSVFSRRRPRFEFEGPYFLRGSREEWQLLFELLLKVVEEDAGTNTVPLVRVLHRDSSIVLELTAGSAPPRTVASDAPSARQLRLSVCSRVAEKHGARLRWVEAESRFELLDAFVEASASRAPESATPK